MGKKAEYTLTIIGRHTNDTLLGDGRPVVAWLTTRAGHQAATIEIDEYGQGVGRGRGRGPDVQIETVLAAAGTTEVHVTEDIGLHGVVTEGLGLAYALPWQDRLRSLPTEIAHRSLCEGNAEELLHAIFFKALKNAILGLYLKSHIFNFLLSAGTEDCKTGNGLHHNCSEISSHNHIGWFCE